MNSIREIRVGTRRGFVVPAVTGLALGCSLAFWLSPRRRRDQSLNIRPIKRPIPEPAVDDLEDELIIELVKSEISRVCAHCDDITVSCTDGVVTLDGAVLETELPRILRCIGKIPGIQKIHDHLERQRMPLMTLLHSD